MPKVHMLHLKREQDISTALYDFLKDKKWEKAQIISGIGSVNHTTIGNPITHDFPPKITITEIDEPSEVLGFTGEIIRKDKVPDDMPEYTLKNPSKYAIHIHITISYGGGTVTGGGFRAATVMRALNILMLELD